MTNKMILGCEHFIKFYLYIPSDISSKDKDAFKMILENRFPGSKLLDNDIFELSVIHCEDEQSCSDVIQTQMKGVEIPKSSRLIKFKLYITPNRRADFQKLFEEQFPGSKLKNGNIFELAITNCNSEKDFCDLLFKFQLGA